METKEYKNCTKNAKEFLKTMGCNTDSIIIDYDRIADYMVVYAHKCGKDAGIVNPIVFDAKEFKALRKKAGYTLRDVQLRTDISNAYLSQLETGKIKNPSNAVVNKLLNLYNEAFYDSGLITGGVKL